MMGKVDPPPRCVMKADAGGGGAEFSLRVPTSPHPCYTVLGLWERLRERLDCGDRAVNCRIHLSQLEAAGGVVTPC